MQLGTTATMRGRVMGLYMLVFLGGTPIGAPIVGWVADAFGPCAAEEVEVAEELLAAGREVREHDARLHVALDAQRHRLDALQQQEGRDRKSVV